MLIIPVIDLSRGMVVHAKQGQRESYQAIKSVISASAEPETVLSSFLELYPFKTIYIADLDAIQKTGQQNELILKLAFRYKQCEFWVDAGIELLHNKLPGYSAKNIKLIFGSENKIPRDAFVSLTKNNPDFILSLDFIDNKLTENTYLLQDATIWTKQLIVMMLSRVGSNKGIDMECLNNILKLAGNNEIYAAGGARNMDDLIQLNSTNVKGALLATALHTGAITKEDLEQFHND